MDTKLIAAAVSAAFLATSAATAQSAGLLYVPNANEVSNQCVLPLTTNIGPGSIQHVVPGAAPTSAAFKTRQTLEVTTGDGDLDGIYAEPNLFGGIDAVMHPVDQLGNVIRPDARNVWFSPQRSTQVLAGGPKAFDSELVRLLPAGVLEKFITRGQIASAFGFTAGPSNVDAAALAWNHALFLSFETQVATITTAHGMVTVQDGAILAIPWGALVRAASPYDGATVITAVAPGSGLIVATEAMVDAMVAASGIRDNSGAPPGGAFLVGDTDGLEVDPQGGYFYNNAVHAWLNNGNVANLIFSGVNLTGAGMVSTQSAIATIGGYSMGNNVTSSGAHVGLVTVPVGSLNGLSLPPKSLIRFTTRSSRSITMGGPGVTLDIESAADPGGLGVLWLHGPGAVAVGGVDLSFAFANSGFPDVYSFAPIASLPTTGCQSWAFPISAATFASIAGTRLLFQSVEIPAGGGGIVFSTPSSVQFY